MPGYAAGGAPGGGGGRPPKAEGGATRGLDVGIMLEIKPPVPFACPSNPAGPVTGPWDIAFGAPFCLSSDFFE